MDGNWQDSSGNGNDLLIQDDPGFSTDSKIGSHTSVFDSNDSAQVLLLGTNTEPLSVTQMTLMVWVKFDQTDTGYQTIVEHGRGTTNWYGLWKSTVGDRFHFRWGPDGNSAIKSDFSTIIVKDQWYHVVATLNPLTDTAKMYVNGVLDTSVITAEEPIPVHSELTVGSNKAFNENFANGNIDELAIFGVALSDSEVKQIYNRQAHKYAGHYDSEVLEFGTSVNCNNLLVTTTLPFNKELHTNHDRQDQYPLLKNSAGTIGDSELHTNLIGLWNLNGPLGVIADGINVLDSTANGYDGVIVDSDIINTIYYDEGILGQYIKFDGVNDSINMGDVLDIGTSDFSVSAWIKTSYIGSSAEYFMSKSKDSVEIGRYAFGVKNCKAHVLLEVASPFIDVSGSKNICDSRWHHIAVLMNRDGNMEIYIDGLLDHQVDISIGNLIDLQTSNSFRLGASSDITGANPDLFYNGDLDEVAVWSRVLDQSEVNQLYRRGANRIKYQVKSCIDTSCKCISMVGVDSNDCDNNSIPNDIDPTDTTVARWLGHNGIGTSFLETQNCTTYDTSGICTSATNSTGPNFNFSSFPTAAAPGANRYFQYRVLMEAEESLACSGSTACLPELTSIEVQTPALYYDGVHVVKNNIPIAYTSLKTITFSDSGCQVSYQISRVNA